MYAINKFFNLWIISIAIIVNRSQSSGKKRNFLQKLQDFQRIPLNFTQKLVNNFYLKNDSHWKYQKCINEQYICVFMPWIELNELLLARFPKFPYFLYLPYFVLFYWIRSICQTFSRSLMLFPTLLSAVAVLINSDKCKHSQLSKIIEFSFILLKLLPAFLSLLAFNCK